MNKMSQIKAAVCLPLYQAAPDTVMKKEDLMDDAEKRYLNKKILISSGRFPTAKAPCAKRRSGPSNRLLKKDC